jgi:hypothetical protein
MPVGVHARVIVQLADTVGVLLRKGY